MIVFFYKYSTTSVYRKLTFSGLRLSFLVIVEIDSKLMRWKLYFKEKPHLFQIFISSLHIWTHQTTSRNIDSLYMNFLDTKYSDMIKIISVQKKATLRSYPLFLFKLTSEVFPQLFLIDTRTAENLNILERRSRSKRAKQVFFVCFSVLYTSIQSKTIIK